MDEANNKKFAIFMHPLIPLWFSKKIRPHHSFQIIKDAKDGKMISNGQLNLILTPEMFGKPVDFTRLLSQWIVFCWNYIRCHCREAFENVEKVAMLVHVGQTLKQPGRQIRQLKGFAYLAWRRIQFSEK